MGTHRYVAFETKRGLTQSTKHFCSKSKEGLKDNQQQSTPVVRFLRSLLHWGSGCAVTSLPSSTLSSFQVCHPNLMCPKVC